MPEKFYRFNMFPMFHIMRFPVNSLVIKVKIKQMNFIITPYYHTRLIKNQAGVRNFCFA